MLARISFLTLVAVAFVALAGLSLNAGDNKAKDAMVVKAGDGKITLTFEGDGKKHTHDVAKDAKITLDDKKAKLEDVKEGFHVSVTMNAEFVLTKIEAKSKAK